MTSIDEIADNNYVLKHQDSLTLRYCKKDMEYKCQYYLRLSKPITIHSNLTINNICVEGYFPDDQYKPPCATPKLRPGQTVPGHRD